MTWDGIERRAKKRGDDPVTINDLDEALAKHSIEERAYTKSMIDEIHKAFPDGVGPHHDYHQSKIDAAKAEEEFWKVAKIEFTRVGVSAIAGVIKVVVVLGVVSIAYKFGLGPLVAKLLGVGT